MGAFARAAILALAAVGLAPALAGDAGASVRARFGDPAGPMLVVAHRACHNPAPRHGRAGAIPENSIATIVRCIDIGVDVAEVDVRRTGDGFLVLLHDDSVDRTTDGHGRVAELSLAALRRLHLRQNLGGADAPVTDLPVPTLEDALRTARGRIILNLDVQAGLYAETVAMVRRLGQEDMVIVKQPAGLGSPVLADIPPFDQIPFMPILTSATDGSDLAEIAARQSAGIRPIAIELPRMAPEGLPALSAIARRAGTRLWINSLWEGFVRGYGGDIDALRDPDAVWGRLRRAGISVIQTDEPDALLHFLGR